MEPHLQSALSSLMSLSFITQCDGLNKNGPHRLIYVNAQSPGNGNV